MNDSILLLIMVFALLSCDPVECVEYNIENNSDHNIFMDFYDSGEAIVSLSIESDQEATLLDDCAKGGIGFSIEFYDSIIVYEDDTPVIQYYTSSNVDNNIYEIENKEIWSVAQINKNLTKYTYSITDDDINN